MFAAVLTAMSFLSCNDESDVFEPTKVMQVQKAICKLPDGTEQFITDKGEVIHITDTTVYEVLPDDFVNISNTFNDEWTNLPLTRVGNYPMRIEVKGFDRSVQSSGYKKWLFNKEMASKYGIPQGMYLVCAYTFSKDLAQGKDESIKPRDYTNNIDDTPMGWLPSIYNASLKYVKGFELTSKPVNGFISANTTLQYIKCDLSGATYAKYIPYEPSNLTWQYVLSYTPSWD